VNIKLLRLLEKFEADVVALMSESRLLFTDGREEEEANFLMDEAHEIIDEAIENILLG